MAKLTVQEFLDNHAWQMQQLFDLEHWSTVICKVNDDKSLDGSTVFKAYCDHTYMYLTIEYGEGAKKHFKQKKYHALSSYLIHEFAHVYTNWVFEFIDKKDDKLFRHHLEQNTQLVANHMIKLYKKQVEKYNIDVKTGLIKKGKKSK